MYKVVFDTNILISAMITPKGIGGVLFNEWEKGKFEVILSKYIIDEFERVLRQKFQLQDSLIVSSIQSLYEIADIVVPVKVDLPNGLIENADKPIIGTAVAGQANFVVTGDRLLLQLTMYKSIYIISPRIFLNKIE